MQPGSIEEEAEAFDALCENFSSGVSREEIIDVENSVWKMKFRPQPLPFVAMSVEEVWSASDLSRWTNNKVRVIGMMDYDIIPWLTSVNEDGGQYRVALDLSIVDPCPPLKHLIQVFGTLEIEMETKIPQIQVLFYRKIKREHLKQYRAALEDQKHHVPMFIKNMSPRQKLKRERSESPDSFDPETALFIQPCYRSAENTEKM